MATKTFMKQTDKVIRNQCSLPAKYWKDFQAPDGADNIYHFCMKIFEALTVTSKDQYLDDDHQGMYSTLMILQFYKNTKLKSQKWLEQTQKIFLENKPKLFEHANWIINLYIKNAQDSQFALSFIASICHVPGKFSWQVQPGQQIEEALKEASDYYDIIELKRRDKPYKKLAFLTFNETIKQSKIGSFSYCCFLDYIRSCNYQPKKKIWLHMVDILKGLIHSLRFTNRSYQLLTLFLHFIHTTLKFYGCAYEQILKDLIYIVNLIRNSPGHNAELAQNLFEAIHLQLKCPGTNFRKQIKRRFVNIDSKRSEKIDSKKYYLTYRKISFGNPQSCSITNLRKLVIYNILGSCKVQNIHKLWSTVQGLDIDTTYELYYKISRILDIAINLQTYESIQKIIRESINDLFKIGWKPFRKLHKEEAEQLADLIVTQNTQKFFQFPNFQIIAIQPQELVAQHNPHSLEELFQERKQYPYNEFFFTYFLEFVFLGNDEQLSKILQIFCNYLITLPSNQYQKLAFYIIPIREGDCSLAQYLAHKDKWYKRHVFNVFRERLLIPFVSLQEPEMKDSFPSYLYTKSLHMYLREAQRKVPIQVFKCQLQIVTQNGNKKDTKTIYFINHVLIGASLELTMAKHELKKEKKPTYVDNIDIYLDKVKKIYPIAVNIQARYKQPYAESLITKMEKFMPIEDLQICNTPKPYFFGYKPNPMSQFIEVSILTLQAGKVFRNQLQSRQNFKRHSDVQIAQAFRDLFINMTVQSIVIERSQGMKDKLRLLIDGVEFNDVQQFKIQPAFTTQKLPLAFPIRCFLPFEA